MTVGGWLPKTSEVCLSCTILGHKTKLPKSNPRRIVASCSQRCETSVHPTVLSSHLLLVFVFPASFGSFILPSPFNSETLFLLHVLFQSTSLFFFVTHFQKLFSLKCFCIQGRSIPLCCCLTSLFFFFFFRSPSVLCYLFLCLSCLRCWCVCAGTRALLVAVGEATAVCVRVHAPMRLHCVARVS